MSYMQLSYLPGICKVNSPYLDSVQQGGANGRPALGRFTDMDKARFVAGMPEKIGGWTKIITTQLDGVPRGVRDFRDYSQNIYLAVGTSCKLYVLASDDITLNTIMDVTHLLRS